MALSTYAKTILEYFMQQYDHTFEQFFKNFDFPGLTQNADQALDSTAKNPLKKIFFNAVQDILFRKIAEKRNDNAHEQTLQKKEVLAPRAENNDILPIENTVSLITTPIAPALAKENEEIIRKLTIQEEALNEQLDEIVERQIEKATENQSIIQKNIELAGIAVAHKVEAWLKDECKALGVDANKNLNDQVDFVKQQREQSAREFSQTLSQIKEDPQNVDKWVASEYQKQLTALMMINDKLNSYKEMIVATADAKDQYRIGNQLNMNDQQIGHAIETNKDKLEAADKFQERIQGLPNAPQFKNISIDETARAQLDMINSRSLEISYRTGEALKAFKFVGAIDKDDLQEIHQEQQEHEQAMRIQLENFQKDSQALIEKLDAIRTEQTTLINQIIQAKNPPAFATSQPQAQQEIGTSSASSNTPTFTPGNSVHR